MLQQYPAQGCDLARSEPALPPQRSPHALLARPPLCSALQLYELMIVMFVYPIVAHW